MQAAFGSLGELVDSLGARADADAGLRAAVDAVIEAIAAGQAEEAVNAQRARQLVLDASRALGPAIGDRVVVIEDLHWVDASSRAALDVLVEALAGTRTLVVATSRLPVTLTADVIVLEPLTSEDVAGCSAATWTPIGRRRSWPVRVATPCSRSSWPAVRRTARCPTRCTARCWPGSTGCPNMPTWLAWRASSARRSTSICWRRRRSADRSGRASVVRAHRG